MATELMRENDEFWKEAAEPDSGVWLVEQAPSEAKAPDSLVATYESDVGWIVIRQRGDAVPDMDQMVFLRRDKVHDLIRALHSVLADAQLGGRAN